MAGSLGHYPPNPAYGRGTFRRRIVLSRDGNRASASMLDDYHEMAVTMAVEQGIIAEVAARMDRFPKTTCLGAVAAVKALRGRAADSRAGLPAGAERSGHCTHLMDLAALALGWFARGEGLHVIEVALTDRDDAGGQHLTLAVDGVARLDWRLVDEVIDQPVEHRGRALFGGFGRWVAEAWPPDEADLWRIAQMAVFVARGRAVIVDGPDPRRALEEPHREGACYSFSGAAFAESRDNIGYVRDMSGGLPPYRVLPGHDDFERTAR